MNRLTEPAAREGAITGALYQFLATSSSFIAGSLFYIYLAKFYTPTDVGNVALLLATVGIFNSIFSLGLSQASQHFISYYIGKGEYSRVRIFVFRTISYGITSSFAAMLSLIFLSSFISKTFFHSLAFTSTVQLLSVYLFALIMFGIFSGILLGMQRFKVSALISIATSTLAYGLSIILLQEFHTDAMIIIGWTIGYVLGTILLGSISIHLSIQHRPEHGHFSYREIMTYSTPILFSGIIGTSAAYIDRFVVAAFVNTGALGIYNFVLLVSSSLSLFLIPLYNVLLPKLSELFSLHDKKAIVMGIKLSCSLISLLYVPAALGATAISGRIIILLSQSQYLSAVIPMDVFLIISAMFITYGVLVQAVSSIRKTPILVLSAGTSLFFNIAFSVILIPRFGLLGAAISNSTVTVTAYFVLRWYIRLNDYSISNFATTLKVWIASGTMAIAVFLLSKMIPENISSFLLLIAFGTGVYILLARLLKALNEDDRRYMRELFGDRYAKLYAIVNRIF